MWAWERRSEDAHRKLVGAPMSSGVSARLWLFPSAFWWAVSPLEPWVLTRALAVSPAALLERFQSVPMEGQLPVSGSSSAGTGFPGSVSLAQLGSG